MPGNLQTPDQVKDNVEIFGNVGDDGTYFDTTAFERVTEVRFGNVGRNTMRGPGVANLDLSLFRTFKLGRQINLQFRAEAFNATNTPHFATRTATSTARTSARSSRRNGDDAMGRSREFRFGLHLTF